MEEVCKKQVRKLTLVPMTECYLTNRQASPPCLLLCDGDVGRVTLVRAVVGYHVRVHVDAIYLTRVTKVGRAKVH